MYKARIAGNAHGIRRKLKSIEGNQNVAIPAKKSSPLPDDNSTDAAVVDRPAKSVKRAVHFDTEPSPADRAQAVSVESLANHAAQPGYPKYDVYTIACTPEAEANLAAVEKCDSKGRRLLRYPLAFLLAYVYYMEDLFVYLKACGKDRYGEIGFTMAAFREMVKAAVGIREGYGLLEQVIRGRPLYMLVVSSSDRPETLPYPVARIGKLQELLTTKALPQIIPYQRVNKCL